MWSNHLSYCPNFFDRVLNEILRRFSGQGRNQRGVQGRRPPSKKFALPQTAHNSAKFFPLQQFQDVGSITFFFGDQQKTRRKVQLFSKQLFCNIKRKLQILFFHDDTKTKLNICVRNFL